MKAILLKEPGKFELVPTSEPARPEPGEALVRVHRVGICGTDISGYLGKMPFYSYPRIPGHELGVEVIAAGAGVSNVKPGDRCSVEPYMNCQQCYACRTGHGNCCKNLKVLGVHTDGGLRPRFIVPARKLHPSAKLTLEQLALVETLGIGCHAVNYVGHTGRLVFVGIVTTEISFPDPLLHAREMTLYASRNALPSDFGRIIRLIEEGRIDTRPWITHRSAFDRLAEDFPAYTK